MTTRERLRVMRDSEAANKRRVSRFEALAQIKAMDDPFITPALAARAMGCDAQYLRIQARSNPGLLGFPVSAPSKGRTKIPRVPFIEFVEGRRMEAVTG